MRFLLLCPFGRGCCCDGAGGVGREGKDAGALNNRSSMILQHFNICFHSRGGGGGVE